MFASLLAASRASNFRLVGCTRTDADIKEGRIPPSGSTSLVPRAVPSVVKGRWTGSEDINGPPESGSVLAGGGTPVGVLENSACEGDGNDDDDVECMNIDFVPSTNRPPRGGSVLRAWADTISGELF